MISYNKMPLVVSKMWNVKMLGIYSRNARIIFLTDFQQVFDKSFFVKNFCFTFL